MAKIDKELPARLAALEAEVEILKSTIRDLAAELTATAATPVPVPPAAVDMSTTNRVLSDILARLDRPIVMKKQFHD
jgi:hypothetical protein